MLLNYHNKNKLLNSHSDPQPLDRAQQFGTPFDVNIFCNFSWSFFSFCFLSLLDGRESVRMEGRGTHSKANASGKKSSLIYFLILSLFSLKSTPLWWNGNGNEMIISIYESSPRPRKPLPRKHDDGGVAANKM